jgi:UDPglucose--hexose-1-phosphate uridylyltransferase
MAHNLTIRKGSVAEMEFEANEHPHRRLNSLTGEYVLVSPHRAKRPWQGQVEKIPAEERPTYDPHCYLCPGNTRTSGVDNPPYEHTYVFTNDFPALLPDTPLAKESENGLFELASVRGTCRVICFSPRHDLSLPEMPVADIRRVVDVLAEETEELGEKYRWVQVFENKGTVMGSSMPHPHGQLWALDALPNEPAKEDSQQRKYWQEIGRPLLLDYAEREQKKKERIVVENDHWLAVVPFWAVWPFELLLLPRYHVSHLPDLRDEERKTLAEILKRLLTKYDNLFEISFPYSMGWHGAPFNPGFSNGNSQLDYWQLHAHFYPPLLRSATVKKFMVGFEMLAEAQRDLTAEQGAALLRDLPEVHYKQRGWNESGSSGGKGI